jgi:hypothetical protein
MFQLCACQLALPEGDEQPQDQLCGMFITFQPLPYDDKDNLDFQVDSSGAIVNTKPSKPRIYYATRKRDDPGSYDYTFDGIEGIRFFEPVVSKNGTGWQFSVFDDNIEDSSGNYTTNMNDDNDTVITGTIPINVRNSFKTIYPNPVYIKKDGSVYTIPGTGVYYGNLYAGNKSSTSVSQTFTETINGKQKKYSFKADLTFITINTPVKSVLKQMDENDRMLEVTLITKDNLPKAIRLRQDTAYMILEEYGLDLQGKTVVERSLIKRDEEELKCRFTGKNGEIVCLSIPLEKQQ